MVTEPNGGEILYAGVNEAIHWDNSTYYTNVRIEYSYDNGTTWNLITSNTSNDGTYSWSVPNLDSELCLIKVSEYNNVSKTDISDNTFTIKPAVKIITPNGDGADLGGCTLTSITFDRSPAWNRYTIEYSTNNGISWNTIQTNWYNNSNPATYDWDIPNIYSDECLVRVKPYYQTAYDDVSDNVFSIIQPVEVIKPNFGDVLVAGSTYQIEWSSDGISNIYDLYYNVNGGSWISIVTAYNTSTNTYDWIVPNNISSNVQIRVVDNLDACKEDVSDQPFEISNTPNPLTILSPNGGENLINCNTYDITWSETTSFGLYDLSYSLDGGVTWIVIENGVSTSTQSYSWTLPEIIEDEVLIKVEDANGNNYDISDTYFSITDDIICTCAAIQTPTNLNFTLNDDPNSVYFSWDAVTLASSYQLRYKINGSNDPWVSLNTSNLFVTATGLKPNTVYDFKVRAKCIDGTWSTLSAPSRPRTPICEPPLNIVDQIINTSKVRVSWDDYDYATKYQIRYREAGSSDTWTPLTTYQVGMVARVINGVVPGQDYEYTVRSYCECAYGPVEDSLQFFNTGTPLLLSPNGGEVLSFPSTEIITWDNTAFTNNVILDYSHDNGVTWNSISNNAVNSGTYSWSLPSILSSNYLIRITSKVNPGYYDISDATFTINALPADYCPLLETPNNITYVISDNPNEVSVAWDAVPNADSYQVRYRKTGSNDSWTSINTTSLTAVVTGLKPNTVYDIKLRSKCVDGTYSTLSAPVRPRTPICQSPLNMEHVILNADKVRIQWDDYMHAEKFQVRYRLANTSDTWSTLVTYQPGMVARVLNGLTPSVDYEYTVRSWCECAYGPIVDPSGMFNTQTTRIVDVNFEIGEVFPNPAKGEISIQINADKELEMTTRIIDINGREVYLKNEVTNVGIMFKDINISTLSDGIYFIQFRIGDKLISKKFIKKS